MDPDYTKNTMFSAQWKVVGNTYYYQLPGRDGKIVAVMNKTKGDYNFNPDGLSKPTLEAAGWPAEYNCFVVVAQVDPANKLNSYYSAYTKAPSPGKLQQHFHALDRLTVDPSELIGKDPDELYALGFRHVYFSPEEAKASGEVVAGSFDNMPSLTEKRKPRSALGEAQRLVSTHEYRNRSAHVYRDSDTSEFVVKFYEGGVHLAEADYFTDDKEDAQGTAKAWTGGAKAQTEAAHPLGEAKSGEEIALRNKNRDGQSILDAEGNEILNSVVFSSGYGGAYSYSGRLVVYSINAITGEMTQTELGEDALPYLAQLA